MKLSDIRVDDSLGERVRARRTELGLSRRALDDGRVSAAYVARIEDGTRTPSIDVVIVLAEKLDTTALWLLTGSESVICPLCGHDHEGAGNGDDRTRSKRRARS